MADNIRATPRNELLGLLADAMYGGLDWMKDPRRTQQMQGLAGLLESTGIPKTTERMAYGEPLTNIGRANVPLLKPETAEAMMNVAPLMPAVGKAGKAVARMAGSEINAAMMGGRGGLLGAVTPQPMFAVNLPKSISGRIGNITPETKTEVKNLAETFAEEINKLGFSAKVEHSGSKAGASSYINVSDPLTGRFLSKPIRISDHSKGAKESQGVIDILNPQDDFKKITDALSEMRGMGETLVFKQNKYADELIASGVKPKTAYQKAKTEITETQPSFQYPQQAALDLAQQRAALPVSEGGLGLPANNTPMDRAKAMGFDTPVYHATDVDFTSINPSVKGKYGAGVYTATTPKYAEIYAQGENARTLPLMARGKLASDDERIAIADQMLEQYQAKEGMDVPLWKKMTKEELANRGYTGVSIGKERLIFNPSDLRSRFAAFDPFRKDVATATAMGVALPDLLAAEPTPEELQRRRSSGLLFP